MWLCIDGSNDDCQSNGVDIAEKGHDKLGKNINIVSLNYAVTEDGKPVTYDVYRGGACYTMEEAWCLARNKTVNPEFRRFYV